MKAMLLAAGYGKRLKPLTDKIPKPLIEVNGKPLIDYALIGVRDAGIKDCVINLCYKGEMIADYVGTGDKWGLRVQYSREQDMLGTGGGVLNALPLLGDETFLLLNCDLVHDVNLSSFISRIRRCSQDNQNSQNSHKSALAHLLLVPSAATAKGDFSLTDNLVIPGNDYTFCGISIINPLLFGEEKDEDGADKHAAGKSFSLVSMLNKAIQHNQVSGAVHQGKWLDLGTLESLNKASLNL